MEITLEEIKRWIQTANEKIQQHKEYLSELDQAIGDGDHGHNMARGFQEAAAGLQDNGEEDVGALVKTVSMTLISKVGGASGPLYGTAFLKAADEWKGKTELTEEAFTKGLEAAVEGLKTRGKAERGSKTLLDVWIPVVEYIQQQGLDAAGVQQKAVEGMEHSAEIPAKKGRASYYGEQSVSHIDPGAYSSYLLFEALAETLNKEEA
ncbi:dihydroxyacetone kinase subunit DhaL [Salibacterium sp. K-3]